MSAAHVISYCKPFLDIYGTVTYMVLLQGQTMINYYFNSYGLLTSLSGTLELELKINGIKKNGKGTIYYCHVAFKFLKER